MTRRCKYDIPRLYRLWNTRLSNYEIAIAMGFSVTTLKTIARRHHLPSRRVVERSRSKSPDPTPEEIAERAAAVRSLWSAAARIERRFGGRRGSTKAFHMYDSDTRLDADATGTDNE